jgi:hypothetical protein
MQPQATFFAFWGMYILVLAFIDASSGKGHRSGAARGTYKEPPFGSLVKDM